MKLLEIQVSKVGTLIEYEHVNQVVRVTKNPICFKAGQLLPDANCQCLCISEGGSRSPIVHIHYSHQPFIYNGIILLTQDQCERGTFFILRGASWTVDLL